MADRSNISWTHATWNPWIGCTKVATECANCYAEQWDARGLHGKERHWGKGAPRKLTKTMNAPLAWNRRPWACGRCGAAYADPEQLGAPYACDQCGYVLTTRRVFCGSLMDWADDEVPDAWRDRVFDVAERCTNLRFLFLTKRIENAKRYLRGRYHTLPDHFWIGMSWMHEHPENVRHLLEIRASIRFLSVEPMLGPVNLNKGVRLDSGWSCLPLHVNDQGVRHIDWVIIGGESGSNARPCNVEWIRDAVRQCRNAGCKVFVKQLGSKPVGIIRLALGCKCDFVGNPIIRDPKGADISEWPADLRVQEIPTTT